MKKCVPLTTPAEKKVLVLLSALVQRFSVSRMRDFFMALYYFSGLKGLPVLFLGAKFLYFLGHGLS